MSKNYALKAEARECAGKGAARALRREDKVPAVIYGDGKEPVTIALPSKELNMQYNTGTMFTTLCDLQVEGGDKHLVLARDVQEHVIMGTVQHVDFLRVTPKTKIAVNVPVNFINEDKCPGLINKGVMNVIRFEVELVCQATNIPDNIDVDMTPFEIGDSIKISDVKLPEGAKPVIDDRDFTIATLAEPRRIEEPTDEEGEEGEEGAEGEAAEGEEGEAAEGGEEKAEGGDE